jgi:hypothetical protein
MAMIDIKDVTVNKTLPEDTVRLMFKLAGVLEQNTAAVVAIINTITQPDNTPVVEISSCQFTHNEADSGDTTRTTKQADHVADALSFCIHNLPDDIAEQIKNNLTFGE